MSTDAKDPGQQQQQQKQLQDGSILRGATLDELDDIAALEEQSYPSDEMASRAKMEARIRSAGRYFQLFSLPQTESRSFAGFVCGTRWEGAVLAEESMDGHHPDAESLCVHSVVIRAEERRKGAGLAMMRAYVQHVRENGGGVKRIVLICKEHLISFYEQSGFTKMGKSAVVHGEDPWFDMALEL